ncbi:uncharacterized protein BT62DRAFT_1009918 [Guyanagaster necrorhizus]|uniref:Uncharacterized protein n=1 Tax=Guyanagaster necrorhizus TaxID=856835 RepID=A0A9P7VLJ1_9AGAR|nr:uncharacterized protein BT62DRAFT_1009918 [Guyanagaster necrorhizus MCA 3950]KAG7442914.1 hypothetical protein BT62DRAFT_1009918 [Guyanagaster necrorhizus MCA 3950]
MPKITHIVPDAVYYASLPPPSSHPDVDEDAIWDQLSIEYDLPLNSEITRHKAHLFMAMASATGLYQILGLNDRFPEDNFPFLIFYHLISCLNQFHLAYLDMQYDILVDWDLNTSQNVLGKDVLAAYSGVFERKETGTSFCWKHVEHTSVPEELNPALVDYVSGWREGMQWHRSAKDDDGSGEPDAK